MPSCHVTSVLLTKAHTYQCQQNHKITNWSTPFLSLMWQVVDPQPTPSFIQFQILFLPMVGFILHVLVMNAYWFSQRFPINCTIQLLHIVNVHHYQCVTSAVNTATMLTKINHHVINITSIFVKVLSSSSDSSSALLNSSRTRA